MASDSSPYGYGACYNDFIPKQTTQQIGNLAEKLRFRFECAISARAHAFASAEAEGAGHHATRTEENGASSPGVPPGLEPHFLLRGEARPSHFGLDPECDEHDGICSKKPYGQNRFLSSQPEVEVEALCSAIGKPPGLEMPSRGELHKLDQPLRDFAETPKSLLTAPGWKVTWSHPWERKANILHTEALALVWLLKHQRPC